MGDFKQDGGKRFGGGRPNFSRKNWGGPGGRERGPVIMHQAICAQCGKPCEVPFRPTEGKPVYCNVCFGKRRETGNSRGGDRFPQKNFQGNNDESKKQFDVLNAKLDRIIKTLTPAVSAQEEKKGAIVKKKGKAKKSKRV